MGDARAAELARAAAAQRPAAELRARRERRRTAAVDGRRSWTLRVLFAR